MIVPMTAHDALQIAGWTYENEYSLYSFGRNSAAVCELMNGEYYAATD
ncbi:MAG: GNAT family N-acetyltransferase, partial [Clostridiales bacterium]|nr:GNAT family N-acetyltransferase [Clostridiales bacterium]